MTLKTIICLALLLEVVAASTQPALQPLRSASKQESKVLSFVLTPGTTVPWACGPYESRPSKCCKCLLHEQCKSRQSCRDCVSDTKCKYTTTTSSCSALKARKHRCGAILADDPAYITFNTKDKCVVSIVSVLMMVFPCHQLRYWKLQVSVLIPRHRYVCTTNSLSARNVSPAETASWTVNASTTRQPRAVLIFKLKVSHFRFPRVTSPPRPEHSATRL